jgi:hypothetical protein
VVVVDMQIARGRDLQVDQRVAGQLVEHVVEEADAGLRCRSVPVPSSDSSTVMSVSAVLRAMVALRMRGSGWHSAAV